MARWRILQRDFVLFNFKNNPLFLKISLSEPLNSTLSTLFILKDKNEQNDKVLIDEDKVKTIFDYVGKAADWNGFNCVDFTCFLWYNKINSMWSEFGYLVQDFYLCF